MIESLVKNVVIIPVIDAGAKLSKYLKAHSCFNIRGLTLI